MNAYAWCTVVGRNSARGVNCHGCWYYTVIYHIPTVCTTFRLYVPHSHTQIPLTMISNTAGMHIQEQLQGTHPAAIEFAVTQVQLGVRVCVRVCVWVSWSTHS